MDMQKYYSQLIGAKVIDFKFENDDYALEPFPVYTLQLGDQKVRFTISQDEEGNGGGFVFIEETK